MKKFALKIEDVASFDQIQQILETNKNLSKKQRDSLCRLLSQFPETSELLSEKIPFDLPIETKIWNFKEVRGQLEKWKRLFLKLPGFDGSPLCLLWDELDLLGITDSDVIFSVSFAPSLEYNLKGKKPLRLYLKTNGLASFQLWSVEDIEKYPQLYNFEGNWAESYYLVVETMKNGWPQQEFPKELQRFLSES